MSNKTKEQTEQNLANARTAEEEARISVDVARENYFDAIKARIEAEQEVSRLELTPDDCEDVADVLEACSEAVESLEYQHQDDGMSITLRAHPAMVRFWRLRGELKEVRDELERIVNPEQPESDE